MAGVVGVKVTTTSPPALNGLYTPFGSPVSGGQKPRVGGSLTSFMSLTD